MSRSQTSCQVLGSTSPCTGDHAACCSHKEAGTSVVYGRFCYECLVFETSLQVTKKQPNYLHKGGFHSHPSKTEIRERDT